jgi:hypothetical protein
LLQSDSDIAGAPLFAASLTVVGNKYRLGVFGEDLTQSR